MPGLFKNFREKIAGVEPINENRREEVRNAFVY